MNIFDEFGGYDVVGQVDDDWDMAEAVLAVQGPGAPITVSACCPIAPIVRDLMGRQPMFSGYLDDPEIAGFFSKAKRFVKKGSRKVRRTAKKATRPIRKAVRKLPGGDALLAASRIASAPAGLAIDVAKGRRPDRALVSHFKQQIRDIRTIAPYAQTVLSFVPGPGQGLSSAIGAGLALAEGRPLDQAMLAGIRSAVPGGPMAQAAFDVAAAAAQGKSLDQVALNAVPVPPAQKRAIAGAMSVVKAAAEGKKVSDAAYRAALAQLPPQYAKAIPAGVAVGQALVKQKAPKVGDVRRLAQAAGARAPRIPAMAPMRALARKSPQLNRAVNAARRIARDKAARQAAAIGRRAIKQQGSSALSRVAFPGVTRKAAGAYTNATKAVNLARQYARFARDPNAIRRVAQAARGTGPGARAAKRTLSQFAMGKRALDTIRKTQHMARRGHPVARQNMAALQAAEQGQKRRMAAMKRKLSRMRNMHGAQSALVRQGRANPYSNLVRSAFQRM